MLWKKIAMYAVASAALAAGPLMAQEQSGGDHPIPAAQDSFSQSHGSLDGYFWQNEQSRRLLDQAGRGYHHGPKDLPLMREHLADAWQHFGMSPGDAKSVASTYDYSQDDLAGLPSIRGKDNHQIAQMMRSALASKQYVAANHLLLSYERQRLNLPTGRVVSKR